MGDHNWFVLIYAMVGKTINLPFIVLITSFSWTISGFGLRKIRQAGFTLRQEFRNHVTQQQSNFRRNVFRPIKAHTSQLLVVRDIRAESSLRS